VAAINGHAIAGGCILACAADRRLMTRDGGRIGVTELLVGVPFPPVAMEIMRCATAPQFLADAIFSGATYMPFEAAERGWVHDVIEEEHALLDRAVEAANALATLPPRVFALSKRQTREPALERMKNPELVPQSSKFGMRRRRLRAFAIMSRGRCGSEKGRLQVPQHRRNRGMAKQI
jgi:enoyl-CoA hydratase/carnithine racemase